MSTTADATLQVLSGRTLFRLQSDVGRSEKVTGGCIGKSQLTNDGPATIQTAGLMPHTNRLQNSLHLQVSECFVDKVCTSQCAVWESIEVGQDPGLDLGRSEPLLRSYLMI